MKYSFLFAFIVLLVSCNQTKPRRPIHRNNNLSAHHYSIALNKINQAREEKSIKHYIEQDSLSSYTISPKGFAYTILKKDVDSTKNPKSGALVTYVKTIYNLRNELIYNSIQETIKIDKSREIKGVEQGLKLMRENEEFKFIFSSFVAYGVVGDRGGIGPNTPIVVEIKLLKIK
ncbi:MAG: FKBP-type peptidyl-prolyl cis-trans isomerase [Wenyingzhuangia sp.]|jgi:gliding motility-associated peptidyl-prolyl isomerase|uniref:FKBP-type peptidyl-prolyl cis-trans isomerase n=1 Tax=Wenyingzhuangia sp. TaxID=1964193 RepID=UPI00321C24AB